MKQKRGFALMDPEELKRITSLGGKSAHRKGTAHKWNRKTAIKAAYKSVLKRFPHLKEYANQKLDS